MPDLQFRRNGSVNLAVQEFFATARRNNEKEQKHELGLSEDDELPQYVFKAYPKAIFTIGGEDSIVVKDAQEEQARLREGWYSTLAEALEAAMAEEPEQEYVTAAQPPKRGAGGRFLPKED